MWRDKSPGLKILWLWTFGTAAVLVTSVVRTRIRDTEQQLMNAAHDETPPIAGSISGENGSSDSDQVIRQEK